MIWRVAFAVLVSSGALMIFVAWATGAETNPGLTATLLAGAPAVMIASGQFAGFRTSLVDVLFVLFVVVALISTAINGLPPTRDAALFGISLLAYPAGRLAPIKTSMRPFLLVTFLIVGIGTIVVGVSLADQWNDSHGRPIVFGFAHGATVFLTSLGFLLFAVVCLDDFQRPLRATIAAVPALVVFAASQVRFTFLALAASLGIAYLVADSRRRRSVAAVLGIVIASGALGLAVRPHTSGIFLKYIVTPVAGATERPKNPVAGECGELDNSVAIRKTLLRQAVQALPSAGLFGHGLGSTAQASCFKTDPHNTALQTVLEFGWIGGALLVLLIVAALRHLWPAARKEPEAAFVLCCLSYVALIDIAHGHLASEGLLFLFLGYAARVSIWVKG